MQGASLESAREEIGRDQIARTPKPRQGLAAEVFVLCEWLVKATLLG